MSSAAKGFEPAAIDPSEFRRALGQYATGVTVVTARGVDGELAGLTANSFSSVSLAPPLVLWSLAKSARSLMVFEATRHFAIHVLSAAQVELSRRFASGAPEKFAGLTLDSGHGSVPLLRDYAARFQCEKRHAFDCGDHIIYVGEVLEFDHRVSEPLLYHAGQYARKAGEER
jgi:3-hydroxy-9,10-secoandrosta-1,3,5(10)-triene-9,17-dione monooxygenase reductase component